MISRLTDVASLCLSCCLEDVEVFNVECLLWSKDCFHVFFVFKVNIGILYSAILDFHSWNETGFALDLGDVISNIESCSISWEVAKFCAELISHLFAIFIVFCRVDTDTVFSDDVWLFLLEVGFYQIFKMEDDVGSLLGSINLKDNSPDVSVLSELSMDIFFRNF